MGRLRLLAATCTLGLAGVAATTSQVPTPTVPEGEQLRTAASRAAPTVVRVGSFNIKNVVFDRRRAETVWPKRRAVIVEQVLRHRVGVLGIQEANYGPGGIWRRGWNQYLDLKAALNRAGGGYRLTVRAAHNCVEPQTRVRCRYQDRGASGGARILFDARLYREVRSGSIPYRHQHAGDRFLAWAVLEVKATGERFLFTTTHLAPRTQRIKLLQWRQMVKEIQRLRGRLPVIGTGDLNASKYNRLTKEMLPAMRRAGFGDVLNQEYRVARLRGSRAQRMVNAWIGSYNRGYRSVAKFGHEDNHRLAAAYLDYIFASNRLPVYKWKTVVRFDRRTLRMERPVPSDHNLVTAVIGLR